MKKPLIVILSLFLTSFCFGQAITGTVKDAQNKPIPFAFVRDAAQSIATYTNAEGGFMLDANPSGKLTVSAKNFAEIVITTAGKSAVDVTLTAGETKAGVNKLASANFFQTNTNNNITTSGSLYLRSSQQEVHGSRYLFGNWVHGYALSPADSLIQSNDYLFNYDKISGDLLFTSDQAKVFTAEKGQVKGFTLFDENVQPLKFERVIPVNQLKYLHVLSDGPKYKIYKQTNTKFEPNNYTTNGITTSGHNYDEYIDESTYFVLKPGSAPQKLDLKSKSIKALFAAEPDKLKKFMSENDGDIDETYIKLLGEAMNR